MIHAEYSDYIQIKPFTRDTVCLAFKAGFISMETLAKKLTELEK